MDSNFEPTNFKISLFDCFRAVEYSFKMRLFKPLNFNNNNYNFLNKIENGYINWIIPKKLLLLSSPCEIDYLKKDFINTKSNKLISILKKEGVSLIIRTSKNVYNFKQYEKSGIICVDLYFPENENPSIEIIKKFLFIVENYNGAFAIQSRTGLRRSAILAAIYLMRSYHYSSKLAISWIRINRPGSICGLQQNFLINLEKIFLNSVNDSKIFLSLNSKQKKISQNYINIQ